MDKFLQAMQVIFANKRMLGTILGLFFGILYLIFGFWKTLVFSLIVLIGYAVGRYSDDREDWRDVIDRILPTKYRE